MGGTLGPTPLGHSHSLASKETGRRRKNNRQAFVRGENWLLLLHAGAPGTDMKKGPSVPHCHLSNPAPWVPCPCVIRSEPCPASHTLRCLCPITGPKLLLPCPVCVAWCAFHVLSHVTHTLDHAPCTMSHLLYDVLCADSPQLAIAQLTIF